VKKNFSLPNGESAVFMKPFSFKLK
jgi:hypothetical protein